MMRGSGISFSGEAFHSCQLGYSSRDQREVYDTRDTFSKPGGPLLFGILAAHGS
jgi:hypothetical protein